MIMPCFDISLQDMLHSDGALGPPLVRWLCYDLLKAALYLKACGVACWGVGGRGVDLGGAWGMLPVAACTYGRRMSQ